MPRTFSDWHHADGVSEAQIEELARTLRSYDILTRARLREFCHGDSWGLGGFELALSTAVRRGIVRHLGGELYEIAEDGQPHAA